MKQSEVLHLVLKRKWFDMIARGEKNEEYREIKPYWLKRFCDPVAGCCNDCRACYKTVPYDYTFKHFDFVCFHFGYTNRKMMFQIKDIIIGTGKVELGAESGKEYIVIKLGERIDI